MCYHISRPLARERTHGSAMSGRGRPPAQDKAAKVARDKATRARCMRALRARRKREVEEDRQSDGSDAEDNAGHKRKKVAPRPKKASRHSQAEPQPQPAPVQAQDSSDDGVAAPPVPPPPPPAAHVPEGRIDHQVLLLEDNGLVATDGRNQPEGDSSEHDTTSDLGQFSGEPEDDEDEQGSSEAAELPDGPNIPLFPVQYVLDPEQEVEDPLRELVNALGAVKARSNVSDAAMEKMIKVSRSSLIILVTFPLAFPMLSSFQLHSSCVVPCLSKGN